MQAARVELHVPGTDIALPVIRYGTWGRPLLVFPSEAGSAEDFASNGMLEAVQWLVDEGRLSIFCVGSLDGPTWSDKSLPTEDRAFRAQYYESWVSERVVPWVREQMSGRSDLMTCGVSLGAYHAVHTTLRRPDLAPLAIGLSGNYDVTSFSGWGQTGQATYFANPTAYVSGMNGDHLDWVRRSASVLLVVGEGPFEWHPTQSYPQTLRMAEVLREKGIPHELDVWGHDSAHDWPWWRKQLAHHLPRFV